MVTMESIELRIWFLIPLTMCNVVIVVVSAYYLLPEVVKWAYFHGRGVFFATRYFS